MTDPTRTGTGSRRPGPGEPRPEGTRRAPSALLVVFADLLAAHGPQKWWPAESAFEVMVGAVLTQNTAWTNVERALAALAERVPLTAGALLDLPEAELAALLRPVGYFNVKARRLRAFCTAYLAAGGHAGLAVLDTNALRHRLLAIDGVGPETADDMLLYAFGRPVFVVDAYTRRLFTRLGVLRGDEGYEAIRARFEAGLAAEQGQVRSLTGVAAAGQRSLVRLFNEYHALIVRQAKEICRARAPRCGDCTLAGYCPSATDLQQRPPAPFS